MRGGSLRSTRIVVVGAAGGLAFALGGLIAIRPALGVGMLGAAAFVALAMVSVPAGIAGWIIVAFVRTIPGIVTSAMLLVIAAAWLGLMVRRRREIPLLLPGQQLLIGALALLAAWLTLSLMWARSWEMGWQELRWWLVAAGIFIVVATAIRSPAHLRLVLFAFVAGGSLSVLVGWAGKGPHELVTLGGLAARSPGRFTGAEGDPNQLAQELIPGIVFALALAADRASLRQRVAFALAAVVMTVGLAATQSRGGLLAAVAVVLLAPLAYARQRRYVAPGVVLVVAVAALSLAISPQARHRVLSFNGGGSGRTTLWLVAWRIARDYQPEGIGLNNFRLVSQDYVLRPGALNYVEQITDQPHLVHNTYLELLAETGIVGLGLFLAVVGACLSAALRAARIFDRSGRADLARLARAVLLAMFGALVAQLFISSGDDWRTWALLAIGPALLALARVDGLRAHREA